MPDTTCLHTSSHMKQKRGEDVCRSQIKPAHCCSVASSVCCVLTQGEAHIYSCSQEKLTVNNYVVLYTQISPWCTVNRSISGPCELNHWTMGQGAGTTHHLTFICRWKLHVHVAYLPSHCISIKHPRALSENYLLHCKILTTLKYRQGHRQAIFSIRLVISLDLVDSFKFLGQFSRKTRNIWHIFLAMKTVGKQQRVFPERECLFVTKINRSLSQWLSSGSHFCNILNTTKAI